MLHIRFFVAACLLGFWLAANASTATAQQEEKPAQLIMSMSGSQLPFRELLAPGLYEALTRQSGQATRRVVLPLTRTELWSIPSRNVDALMRAAVKAGVRVDRLEADWDQLFRRMPGGMLTNGHQNLAPRPEWSKGASAVHMMLPPQAAMMEYALTRDAGATPQGHLAKIRLRLNENTVLTLTRTSVEVRSDMCVWRGTVDGTGTPATIMWWPGVAMAGTVRHEGRIYSFRHRRGGQHEIAITEMSEDRMPPEHAPMRQRLKDPNLRDDPLTKQGDASMLKPSVAGVRHSSPFSGQRRP